LPTTPEPIAQRFFKAIALVLDCVWPGPGLPAAPAEFKASAADISWAHWVPVLWGCAQVQMSWEWAPCTLTTTWGLVRLWLTAGLTCSGAPRG
jgi:hypothetical protein